MRTEFEAIKIIQSDRVVHLVLNRPEKRNAISHQMQAEIDIALDEAEIDPDVGAVVLRGEGKLFTAGHDLGEQSSGQELPGPDLPQRHPLGPPPLPPSVVFPQAPDRRHPQLRGRIRYRPRRLLRLHHRRRRHPHQWRGLPGQLPRHRVAAAVRPAPVAGHGEVLAHGRLDGRRAGPPVPVRPAGPPRGRGGGRGRAMGPTSLPGPGRPVRLLQGQDPALLRAHGPQLPRLCARPAPR